MAARQSSRQILTSRLLTGLTDVKHDREVYGIALDSRKVNAGDLFLACHGDQSDGSSFIRDAITAGAVAIAIESDQKGFDDTGNIPVYPIQDLRRQAGLIAARFYDFPSREINVIGITGTNGKTSVAWSIEQALRGLGKSCGLMGTLGHGISGELKPGNTTTPDPVTLQSLLSEWRSQKVDYVAMEVSSHALDQGRVSGVEFDVAVFTNLSRDHLDYHQTMSRYAAAKEILFSKESLKHAVLNLDDVYGRDLISKTRSCDKVGYSVLSMGRDKPASGIATVFGIPHVEDGRPAIIDIDSPWGRGQLEMQLVAEFKISNLLASLSSLCVLGIPFDMALEFVSRSRSVPGRMECFDVDSGPLLVVDYAHTPDAIRQVLVSLRRFCRGRLICVFGCGGERDKGKRAVMGQVAEQYADAIVVTNDNPRGEDPDDIIRDIIEGITDPGCFSVKKDRATAIEYAARNAQQGDIVVIAGKGHETYQEIAGRRYPFSDRELVRRLAGERK